MTPTIVACAFTHWTCAKAFWRGHFKRSSVRFFYFLAYARKRRAANGVKILWSIAQIAPKYVMFTYFHWSFFTRITRIGYITDLFVQILRSQAVDQYAKMNLYSRCSTVWTIQITSRKHMSAGVNRWHFIKSLWCARAFPVASSQLSRFAFSTSHTLCQQTLTMSSMIYIKITTVIILHLMTFALYFKRISMRLEWFMGLFLDSRHRFEGWLCICNAHAISNGSIDCLLCNACGRCKDRWEIHYTFGRCGATIRGRYPRHLGIVFLTFVPEVGRTDNCVLWTGIECGKYSVGNH